MPRQDLPGTGRDEPQTVSNRILEIREYLLGDDQFGQVLKPLALGTFEFCP